MGGIVHSSGRASLRGRVYGAEARLRKAGSDHGAGNGMPAESCPGPARRPGAKGAADRALSRRANRDGAPRPQFI